MSLVDEPARRHSARDHQAKQIKRRKKTEAERAAERAKREAKREANRALIAQVRNANQVLTFAQWCLLAGIDACEEAEIAPVISISVRDNSIIIADNGPGIPAKTIKGILDYSIRVSSREAYGPPISASSAKNTCTR